MLPASGYVCWALQVPTLSLSLTLTLILTLTLTLTNPNQAVTLTLTNPNQALCQAAATFFARPSFYNFVVCALNALLTG